MRSTLVIGHRGAPRRALENTLDSFDAAEAEGADGFELDVRLTSDGEAVVVHDPEIRNGDRRVSVASLTLHEVLALRLPDGEREARVPTLAQVLERYGPTTYLVEIKPGPSPRPGLLEYRVAGLLSRFNLLGRATVLSFSADVLRRVHQLEPRLRTCLNFDPTHYRPAGSPLPDVPEGCTAVGPQLPLATDALFEAAKARGLDVHVWTVNEAEAAARLTRLGAASVITDVPGEVGEAVRSVTASV